MELHVLTSGVAGMPPCPVYVVGAGDGTWGFKHSREAVCQLSHTLSPLRSLRGKVLQYLLHMCRFGGVGSEGNFQESVLSFHVGFRVGLRLSELAACSLTQTHLAGFNSLFLCFPW